jgi:hypothetical protein
MMVRILAMAALAALLSGCSGFGGGSLESYLSNPSKASCGSATAEEVAADEAMARPECNGLRERDKLDAS